MKQGGEKREMKKKRLILGLAISGAVFTMIFLGTFFAAGQNVTDDHLWVQLLFVGSGAMGIGLLFDAAVISVKEFSKRKLGD